MMKHGKRLFSLALTLIMALALLPTAASAASRGELVIPCEYEWIADFHNGTATIRKGKQAGLIDTAGKVTLLPGQYDIVRPFTAEGIAPVGNILRYEWTGHAFCEWGLIDTTGKLIVSYENQGTNVLTFPSGLVVWTRDGKQGLLGANGQVVTPFKYDRIDSFRVDYAPVSIGNKVGLIDGNGHEVVPCVYDGIIPLGSAVTDGYAKDGMIQVMLNGKYGFVNTSGELVIPCKYDWVSNFSGGYAAVGTAIGEIPKFGVPDCKWGIVNTAGQEVVSCQYSTHIYEVSEGFMAVKQNDKWGFVNTANQLVVPYKYDGVSGFRNGFAIVWKDDLCGYIDTTGKEVVPCIYDFTIGFFDGLALFQKGDKSGFVDTSGKVAIPFEYYAASDFHEGFAQVKKTVNGKYAFIDTAGRTITPFQYDNTWIFKGGTAMVERNGKLGYVDTAGREVVPCKYDTTSDNLFDRYGDLAVMRLNGKYGLVSTATGQELTPFVYDSMSPSDGDYMIVEQDGSYGVIYIGTGNGPAPATTAYANPQTVWVDNIPVQFNTYALKDENGNPTNYIKLRDLAYVLGSTASRFSVDWNGAILLTTGQPYSANGSEMATPFSGNRPYTISNAKVFVNGQEAQLDAFTLTDDNGGDYTYFKLRDLGRALGFNVSWDSARGVYIETNKPYMDD